MRPEHYRKRQISQANLPPKGAFVAFLPVKTGLSEATCPFVFYEKASGLLVMDDIADDLKAMLANEGPTMTEGYAK